MTKAVSKSAHFFGSSGHEHATEPANDYPGPSTYAQGIAQMYATTGSAPVFSTADRMQERRKVCVCVRVRAHVCVV